jgi:hypothetical protein
VKIFVIFNIDFIDGAVVWYGLKVKQNHELIVQLKKKTVEKRGQWHNPVKYAMRVIEKYVLF